MASPLTRLRLEGQEMTDKHQAPSSDAWDELREYAAIRDEIIGLLEGRPRLALAASSRPSSAAGDALTTASGSSNDSRQTF